MLRFKWFTVIVAFCCVLLKSYGQCVTASASATSNLCIGDTVYLTCSYDTSCFSTGLPTGCVQKFDSLSPQHYVQGGTPYAAKSIYGNFYKGYRFQFLYTASEIQTVFDTGYVTQLAFRIGQFNSNASLSNFTIRMRSVSPDSTSLTDWQTGMTTVYGPQIYTPNTPAFTGNWNYHVLSTPFYWDGVSNLVIEVTHYNPVTSSNLVNMMSVTTDSGKVLYAMGFNDVYSLQNPPTLWHERPVLMMKLCASTSNPSPFDSTTIVGWTTTGANSVQYDSIGNAFAVITSSQSYKATVLRNNIYKVSAPLNVSMLAAPKILPGSFSICEGAAHSIYTSLTYDSYVWSNGDTAHLISVSDSGWYSVTVTQNGCVAQSADSIYAYAVPPMNAYVTITPGSNPGENVVTVLPQVASHYWLHRTYDTIAGTIYVSNMQSANQITLTCHKDSNGTISSNYLRWILEDAHFCRDTTEWYELMNCLTGIEENEQLSFSVFPNPVDDVVTITLNETGMDDTQFFVTDMQGRMMNTVGYPSGTNKAVLSTTQLQKGIYTLHVLSGNRSGRMLLVK